VYVDFRKNSFLKKPIRAGTIEETTPIQRNFFETLRAACIAAGGEEDVEEEEAEEIEKEVVEKPRTIMDPQFNRYTIGAAGAVLLLAIVLRFLMSPGNPEPATTFEVSPIDFEYLGKRINQFEGQMKTIQKTLDDILAALQDKVE